MPKKASTKPTKVAKLECPKCHEVWAEIAWDFDRAIEPGDIKVYGSKKGFKKDETLACTKCSYPYTNWDIMLAMAAGEGINGKK